MSPYTTLAGIDRLSSDGANAVGGILVKTTPSLHSDK